MTDLRLPLAIPNIDLNSDCKPPSSGVSSLTTIVARPVTFGGVKKTYLPGIDINIRYKADPGCKLRKKDWIALVQVPCESPKEYITFQWASRAIKSKGYYYATFVASQLPKANPQHAYQFLYVGKQKCQILGASNPFLISQVFHNVRRLLEEASGYVETSTSCTSVPSTSLWEDISTLNMDFAVDRNMFLESHEKQDEACLELQTRGPLSVLPWLGPQHYWSANGWRRPIYSMAKTKVDTANNFVSSATESRPCAPSSFTVNPAINAIFKSSIWSVAPGSIPRAGPLTTSSIATDHSTNDSGASTSGRVMSSPTKETARIDMLRRSNVRLKKASDQLKETGRRLEASVKHKSKRIQLLTERIKNLTNELKQVPELKSTIAQLGEEKDSLLKAQECVKSQLDQAKTQLAELECHVSDIMYTLAMEGYDTIIGKDADVIQLPSPKTIASGSAKQLDLRNWTVKDAAVNRLSRSLKTKDESLAKCEVELSAARVECSAVAKELRSLRTSHASLLAELDDKARRYQDLLAESDRRAASARSDAERQGEFMEGVMAAFKALLQESQETIRVKDADILSAHASVAELTDQLADVRKQLDLQRLGDRAQRCRCARCSRSGRGGKAAVTQRRPTVAVAATCHQPQTPAAKPRNPAMTAQPSKSTSWFQQRRDRALQKAAEIEPRPRAVIGCGSAAAPAAADQSVSDVSLSAAFARLFGSTSQQSIPSSASTSTESIASVLRLLFREDGLSAAASSSSVGGPARATASCADAALAPAGNALMSEPRVCAPSCCEAPAQSRVGSGPLVAPAEAVGALTNARRRRRAANSFSGVRSQYLRERLLAFRWARENRRCPNCDLTFTSNASRSSIRRHLNQHSFTTVRARTPYLPHSRVQAHQVNE